MTRQEFIDRLTDLVSNYIEYYIGPETDMQVRINPLSKAMELDDSSTRLDGIADNDEAVESAAAADSDTTTDAADYQVKQNPDYYSVASLIVENRPNKEAISKIADIYYK